MSPCSLLKQYTLQTTFLLSFCIRPILIITNTYPARQPSVQRFLQAILTTFGRNMHDSNFPQQLMREVQGIKVMAILTRDAVNWMKALQRGYQLDIVVELRKIKKVGDSFIKFEIFDGQNCMKGFIDDFSEERDLLKQGKGKNASLVVRILEHETHTHVGEENNSKMAIQIIDFQILESSESKDRDVKIEVPAIFMSQPKFEYFHPTAKKLPNIKQEPREEVSSNWQGKTVKKERVEPIPDGPAAQGLTEEQIRDFEKIADLYEGLHAWELLVRVIDKSYRELTTKAGRQITVLNLELIDRMGYIIEACFFGDLADKHNQIIFKGKVYRIRKGVIKLNTYSSKKSDKHSIYSLNLGRDTAVAEVREVASIPKCSNNWWRLKQVIQHFAANDFYSTPVILIEVTPEKVINKEDRTLYIQTLSVMDPITGDEISVILWNRQIKTDLKQMKNKSILLKNFKVTKYKEDFNLSSSFKSDIVPHDFFKDYEGKVGSSRTAKKIRDDGKVKTMADLQHELKQLDNRPIYSHLNVWIQDIKFEFKWFYEACTNPKCKKAAVSYSRCANCMFELTECQRKFILPLELCDFTGSLYTTAFDQSANTVLKGTSIQDLVCMMDKDRKEFGELFRYDSYKVTICSKRDDNGRIRHSIVGNMMPIVPDEICLQNIDLIKQQRANNLPVIF